MEILSVQPMPLSLNLSVSVIIDNMEIVGAGSQRANVGDMKKNDNHVNPPNIQ